MGIDLAVSIAFGVFGKAQLAKCLLNDTATFQYI